MSLKLIIGRSGTGKSQYCLEEIARRQETAKGRLILIVPEQFSSQAELDLIRKTKGKGILNAQVLSFGRLAHYIFAEKGISRKTPLSDIGKSMVLKKVLLDLKDELTYFQHAIDKQGFVEQLSLTVSEIFQYSIPIEKIALGKSKIQYTEALKNKMHDLDLIYKGYKAFLQKDYISSDETLDLLADKMEDTKLVQYGEFWLDGFYGFTPQEYKVIVKLLQLADRVTITLTMDKRSYYNEKLSMSSLFFEAAVTSVKLNKIAEEYKVKIEPPLFMTDTKRFMAPTLSHLEKSFYSYPYKSSLQSEGISIYAASNQYNEIHHMANKMISMIREKGWRYREIAVVMKNIEDYEKLLEGILLEYQIPCFIDAKREILSHPLIEFVRSAVDMVVHNFSYEGVFRCLKTGLTGIDQEDIDLLENYVLAYGIKGYKWQLAEWNFGFSQEDTEQKEKINTLKKQLGNSFDNFFKAVKRNRKYKVVEITTKLFELINTLPVTDCLHHWIQQMNLENNLTKAREHEQIWSIMVGVFDKMVAILGEDMVTIEQYAKLLDAGLNESKMGIIPPSVDQIIIGDLERTRLPQIKALFVLGVNEGILPAPSDATGIFSEQERSSIEKAGVQLAPNGKRRAFEEQYLIYCGITKPSEYLYLSYCAGDLAGKAMRPSSLLNRLKSIFPNLSQEYENDLKSDSLLELTSAEPAFHELGNKVRNYVETGEVEAVWKDAFSFYQLNEKWRYKLEFILSGIEEQYKKEFLKRGTVKKMYGGTILSSISRLEKYAACPFAYFIQYNLKAKERKLYQLETPDLGNLFHEVLQNFAQTLEVNQLDWKDLNKEETERFIDKAVEAAAPKLGNQILLETAANQHLIKRLKRVSKRAAWTLTEHIKKGTFQPYGYEIGFGETDKMPPIIIDLSNGEKMVMRGKIDRVDILDKDQNSYIKIIDYKSGSKEFSLQDIYYGLQLQLILYLDAFLKFGEARGLPFKPGGIFYFRIKDPMVKSIKEMTPSEIYDTLFRELKMSGLVLDNKDVIKGMDELFEGGNEDKLAPGSSKIIPVAVKNDGNYKKIGTDVADEESYEKLMKFARKKAQQIGENILNGMIDIKPYKIEKNTPCTFCKYLSICNFDSSSREYQYIRKIEDKEFWKKIEQPESDPGCE